MPMNNPNNIKKESIEQLALKRRLKTWMKSADGIDRMKLGQWCGVSKRTVDNWLSSKKPIPKQKCAALCCIMDQLALLKKNNPYNCISN